MSMGFSEKHAQQQMILDKAYDVIIDKVNKKIAPEKESKELKAVVEVKEPDIGDKFYVFVRTYCPDWLFIIIVVVGIYGVFHRWINKGLTQILGFNLEDLKQTVKRRKERDKELKENESK